MEKPQATPLGIAAWIFAIPVLYYASIFPVTIGMNLCYERTAHAPGPLLTALSGFYYPWSVAADALPVLGWPLDMIDRLGL